MIIQPSALVRPGPAQSAALARCRRQYVVTEDDATELQLILTQAFGLRGSTMRAELTRLIRAGLAS